MPNLIDLRRRIRSVKNTQQITSAMKMVSAAKLRRAQDRVIAARPYASLMRDMLGSILAQLPEGSPVLEHELLQRREEKKVSIEEKKVSDRSKAVSSTSFIASRMFRN